MQDQFQRAQEEVESNPSGATAGSVDPRQPKKRLAGAGEGDDDLPPTQHRQASLRIEDQLPDQGKGPMRPAGNTAGEAIEPGQFYPSQQINNSSKKKDKKAIVKGMSESNQPSLVPIIKGAGIQKSQPIHPVLEATDQQIIEPNKNTRLGNGNLNMTLNSPQKDRANNHEKGVKKLKAPMTSGIKGEPGRVLMKESPDVSGYMGGKRDNTSSQELGRFYRGQRSKIVPMEIASNGEEKSAVRVPGPQGSVHSNHVQSEYPRPRAAMGGFLREANPNLSSPVFAQSTGTVQDARNNGAGTKKLIGNSCTSSNEAGDGDDDRPLLKRRKQGWSGLEFVKEKAMHEQTLASMFITVFNYIKSDIRKKTRAFRIGVVTIFIVVGFITMLKSIIDVAPIAFLKVGQDQAGAFDFTLMSDYSAKLVAGDVNVYNLTDLFEEAPDPDESKPKSLVDQFDKSTLADQGDHAEIFGFSLIKFDAYREKLDALNSTGVFRGFSPRWQLPTKIRNISNPATNTSNILIVLDSAREVDNRMGQYFSREVLGDSEIMISSYALRHLDVPADRKHKVEVYFDVLSLMDLFATTTGSTARNQEGETSESVNRDLNNALKELLPSTDQLIDILKDTYQLPINEDRTLKVDIRSILENNFNLTDYNVTIPTFDIFEVFPQLDPALLEQYNITSQDGQNDLNLRDILDGDLTVNLAQVLALVDGQNVTSVDVPIAQALDIVLNAENIPTTFSHQMTVIDDFEATNGKFGDQLGNVALIDCHYANRLLLNTYDEYIQNLLNEQPLYYILLQQIDETIKSGIDGIDFCNYALQVQGVLENQVDVYTGSEAQMNYLLGQGGNLLNDALGYDANVTISTPLKTQLQSVELITIFMDSIMLAIVAFLCILSTKLIYSLMLSDVEEKTYEFGMLRALGFNTTDVKVTITTQSFFFSVPGLLLGLVLASGLNAVVRWVLYTLTNNIKTYSLSDGALVIGVSIGLGMPLISNYFPIQKALGQNLRQSLDLFHRSRDGQLTITQKRLSEYGLSPAQFVMATMFVVLGILTYYVAPTAFLFKDFAIFFLIINGVLIMMVVGLTFLAVLVLPYVQKLLVNILLMLMPTDWRLKGLIYKSMETNKKRNTNTAIMFALCLSFLIFAGSAFELFAILITSGLESQLGTDLYGVTFDSVTLNEFIDEGPIAAFLQEQQDIDGAVVGWTFSSPSLKYLLRKFDPIEKRQTYFSDFAGYKQVKTNIYAIQDNFLEVTKSQQFYMPNELEPALVDEMTTKELPMHVADTGEVDAVKLLYSDLQTGERFNKPDQYEVLTSNYNYGFDGRKYDAETGTWEKSTIYLQEVKVLIPEGFRDYLSLDTDRSARICIGKQKAHDENFCESTYRVKIRGMVTKMPGWMFTSYQAAQFFSQQLVTEEQYKALLTDFFNKNEDAYQKYNTTIADYDFNLGIPKYKLFVRLKDDIRDDRREYIANGIRSYFKGDGTIMLDLAFAKRQIKASIMLFKIFVGIIGFIALTLAFFLLLVSTTQNVKAVAWEYGCLRATGLTETQGMKLFMVEQYALILASLGLGTANGLVLACVVTAQFFLFLEFKFTLIFPTEIVVLMYGTALLTTFIAVYLPVRAVNKKKVSQTLKGMAS